MDPISMVLASAAAGGVAGKLAEKATDFVMDLVRGQDAAVQQKAAENAASFLGALSAQLSRLEQRGGAPTEGNLDATLSDPDVAATVRTAIIGAARTENSTKHAVLARAVAERLVASAESNEALASVLAVDAIPKLSAAHLRFLGIAAVVYVVRPEPYRFGEREGHIAMQTDQPRRDRFGTWLTSVLERLHLGIVLGDLELVHLVSTGCITYERKLKRDLHVTLAPSHAELADPRAFLTAQYHVAEFLALDPTGRDLSDLWEFGLQHVTLTPAGRLIGAAVYESVGGDPDDVGWSKVAPVPDQVINDAVWDGRTIREEFMEALDREVRNRAERRVRPWAALDRQ
ncbi:MAG TPA: LPO_1073/Vpar_1526 family protein [Thermomicrobiales bacterium]|nr:LPO_1073/Vpar_1526 family protein [Thermomicrobiales bacterium]